MLQPPIELGRVQFEDVLIRLIDLTVLRFEDLTRISLHVLTEVEMLEHHIAQVQDSAMTQVSQDVVGIVDMVVDPVAPIFGRAETNVLTRSPRKQRKGA